MPILPPIPNPVPFDEVAAVLAEAALRARGGPPGLIPVAGGDRAAALDADDLRVVRAPGPRRIAL